MRSRIWVKICGIRDVATAREVVALRPQAIGLNFYERSPRAVEPHVAAEIVRLLPEGVEAVGVFVNSSIERVEELARSCRLGAVQLHGDEPPEFLAELGPWKIYRAFRVGPEGIEPLAEYLDRCRELRALPAACLVDACVEGQYGGSGRTVDWETLRREYRSAEWPPLILAGGLDPGNVAEAIRIVQPWGVDVASGVETTRGVKSRPLVGEFLRRAASV